MKYLNQQNNEKNGKYFPSYIYFYITFYYISLVNACICDFFFKIL